MIDNSITKSLEGQLLGHDPAKLPRDAIAWDDDQARYRFSTDSPMRTTTGDLEAMANYAGQGVGLIREVVPAAARIDQMTREAVACLAGDPAFAVRTNRGQPDHLAASGSYASPPCLAHEIDPAYFDPKAVDPEQARDVARWRKAKRTELLAARKILSVADHAAVSAQIAAHLEAILERDFNGAKGRCFSLYWPIKGEPDLRPLMARLHDAGVTIALPLVETKAAPLVFRLWTPETKMIRGDWNIPVPPPEAKVVTPDIALAPLVGWDEAGYRLGYGGGYFDRTLAALAPAPFVIGVGYAAANLETIFPQPHDIAMNMIVTEAGAPVVKVKA